MADVYPFRGLCYAQEQVSIENAVTQPYDKISNAMRDRYYELDPHNIVRIVLGRPEPGDSFERNVYTRAADYLRDWRASGALKQIPAEAFWVYRQRYSIPGTTEERMRRGFIGLGRIEDYDRHVIFPHERTLAGPKADRLELLRHTRAHFEQIFMLYEDPESRIDRVLEAAVSGDADIRVTDEYGVEHALWKVESSATVRSIQDAMRGKRLIIADGHHRYETALRYRDERRAANPDAGPDAPFERLPMTFFNMDAPGLTILATHRVVSRLAGFNAEEFMQRASEYFDVSSIPAADVTSALPRSGRERPTMGVRAADGSWLLSLKPSLHLAAAMPDLTDSERILDVVLLHRLLIEGCLGVSEEAIRKESHVTYVRELNAAMSAVGSGEAQIAFLLNPTRIEQMRDLAYAGKIMPQKSTDFYPKVLSGLVIHALDGPGKDH